MTFSERYGYKAIRNAIQLESMDEPLRNGLWSILDIMAFQGVENASHQYALVIDRNKPIKTLCQRLWLLHFKEPIDTLNDNWRYISNKLRTYYFSCPWNEVYDFIEFVHDHCEIRGFPESFAESCNSVLQREMSAYRFVSGKITRITEEEQIAEIEKAAYSDKEGVRSHIRRSLDLLSSRTNPDYRNSIK
ncbi:MAG: AbiJ-NTD4 domain-containing protein [Immundisolibacter sp.]|uniref:AbiJ-NTD4 domain-containing protein n=1 Tax=Immundisolibacter sp. TaxID=1934948 RepID=UPI003D1067A5